MKAVSIKKRTFSKSSFLKSLSFTIFCLLPSFLLIRRKIRKCIFIEKTFKKMYVFHVKIFLYEFFEFFVGVIDGL